MFNPSGLPLVDDAPSDHPKVQELHALTQWAEGMVWCSPERHGAMTGLMKTQIDWIPLSVGAVRCARPTQRKTLAVMQVSSWSIPLACSIRWITATERRSSAQWYWVLWMVCMGSRSPVVEQSHHSPLRSLLFCSKTNDLLRSSTIPTLLLR